MRIINTVEDLFTFNLWTSHIYVAMTALAFYEYFLTLPDECDIVWRPRKFTGVTWLFLCDRYLMLFKAIVQVLIIALPQLILCSRSVLIAVSTCAGLFPALIAAVFTALRLYAVAKRAGLIAGFVLALGIIPVIMTACFQVWSVQTDQLGNSCVLDILVNNLLFEGFSNPKSLHILSYIGPCAAILSDVLVVAITWIKTLKPAREAQRLGLRSGVVWILFRDGSIYFVALTIMNISQILEYRVWAFENSPIFSNLYPVGGATGLLQQILISRFIINLQRCTNNTDGMLSTIGHEPTIRHASMPSSRRPGQTIHLINSLFEDMGGELSMVSKAKTMTRSTWRAIDETGSLSKDISYLCLVRS